MFGVFENLQGKSPVYRDYANLSGGWRYCRPCLHLICVYNNYANELARIPILL